MMTTRALLTVAMCSLPVSLITAASETPAVPPKTAASAQSASEAPFSFDAAPGRLPKDVVPLDYEIAIVPKIDARTFSGKESVKLQVRSATTRLVFNTLDLKLHDVRFDGAAVQNVRTDNDGQLTTVTLTSPAQPGDHKLTLSYDGVILQRPQGLFVQPYQKADGGKDIMLSTQLEATDARRVFPCWDEPAFRATFQLTATIPAAWKGVSNMPIASQKVRSELATVSFERSPRMPTYLIDFNAGDLVETSATSNGTRFGVWTVRGREQDGAVALANAQQILADYNDYFGYAFPLPKLDSIAIPGGFSGAMENWGAITYMDQALLLSNASSIEQRQQVYSTQAHEMAHQWNGDLVTMGWWDDMWLNESFASWRAAKETDLRNPSWKWWEAQDAEKENAMLADAQSRSHAIYQPVADETQADSAADPEITYNKGQAVLRMFENYLGSDTFRDGIRAFMKAHAFSNATSADLWQALGGASHRNVRAIIAAWTQQPGFPLVSVGARCETDGKRTVTLTQQRFLLRQGGANTSATTHWSVPLQVRTGASTEPKSVLLTTDGQREAAGSCNEPLSINANALGFFRAKYDDATLRLNTRNFDTLPDGDRIALLDDQWALVDAGAAPLASYLMLAEDMGGDLDARAWTQIAQALGTVEYDERGTPGHDAFAAYAASVLKPAADRLGWDNAPDDNAGTKSLRQLLLDHLGAWGDRGVISEARGRLARFRRDHSTLGPDDQKTVLMIVARYADAATFDQLHEMARQAKDDSERLRLYRALAAVRDPKLAEQVEAIATSNDLPPQDVTLPLQMLATLRGEHPKLAWDSFSARYEKLLAAYGDNVPLILTQLVPSSFWNAVPPDELERWLRAHVPQAMASNVDKAVQEVGFKVSEKAALIPAADAYVSKRPSG
jgi:aminopeptidase N